MPKPTWASSVQKEWLLAKLPDLADAQAQKATTLFFAEVYREFHDKWPVTPTEQEIAAAKSEEEAKAIKEKKSESVGDFLFVLYSG